MTANGRERIIHVLRGKGLLCRLPTELTAHAQPIAIEELKRLAAKAAQGGPVFELIGQERREEV
jgi:hypothetical protein